MRIRSTSADGSQVEVECYAEASCPQVIAEVKAAALAVWAELVDE